MFKTKKNGIQGNCDFDLEYDSNLIGIYDEDKKIFNRTIAVCDSNMKDDLCFDLDVNGIYTFRGKIVKVAKTKMFLGRAEHWKMFHAQNKTCLGMEEF